MGSIHAKKIAVFVNKSLANINQMAATAAILLEAPDADVIDLAGDNSATIDAHIASLSANTYDDIFVLSAIASTHATSVINYDQISDLRVKLKVANRGTSILTSQVEASGSNSTTVAYLGASASAVGDYYNGLFWLGTAGTHSGILKKILDYSATTRLMSVGGAAVSGAFDNTDAYQVIYCPHLVVVQDPANAIAAAYLYDTDYPTANVINRTWNYIHDASVHQLPLWLDMLAKNAYMFTATASAGGNTTLTYAPTGGFGVTDTYVGAYVYISSGTGSGQWARIKSHTDTVLTCEYFNGVYEFTPQGNAAWTTNPSSDSVFYIVSHWDWILAWESAQLFTKTYLYTPTSSTILANWKKLIDDYGNLYLKPYGGGAVDLVYQKAAFKSGLDIYNALNNSVTLV